MWGKPAQAEERKLFNSSVTVGVAVWQKKQQAKQFCALLFRFRSTEVFKKLCRAYLPDPTPPSPPAAPRPSAYKF